MCIYTYIYIYINKCKNKSFTCAVALGKILYHALVVFSNSYNFDDFVCYYLTHFMPMVSFNTRSKVF